MTTDDQWWLVNLRNLLVWARLRIIESGAAEVFNAAGETMHYDDEDAARMALLDADFRHFDGLDDEDAAQLGFDLDSIAPPHAQDDEALLPLMTQKIPREMQDF